VSVDGNARAEVDACGSESRTGAKALRRSALATTFVVDDEKRKVNVPIAVRSAVRGGTHHAIAVTFFMPSSGGRTVFRYRSCMAAACTACVSALMMRGRLALHRSRKHGRKALVKEKRNGTWKRYK
jgi:hypothetical protein